MATKTAVIRMDDCGDLYVARLSSRFDAWDDRNDLSEWAQLSDYRVLEVLDPILTEVGERLEGLTLRHTVSWTASIELTSNLLGEAWGAMERKALVSWLAASVVKHG